MNSDRAGLGDKIVTGEEVMHCTIGLNRRAPRP
jgi:hypothetical protein